MQLNIFVLGLLNSKFLGEDIKGYIPILHNITTIFIFFTHNSSGIYFFGAWENDHPHWAIWYTWYDCFSFSFCFSS